MDVNNIKVPEDLIRKKCFIRISNIFHVSNESLKGHYVFGKDLKASFVSDFKSNELDTIFEDVFDVMDHKMYKNFISKEIVIKTVDDYCNHMIGCYINNPKEVIYILNIDNNNQYENDKKNIEIIATPLAIILLITLVTFILNYY